MHEIPPEAEAMLREHGVTDAELQELRRTGSIQRQDDAGSSFEVRFAASTSIAGDMSANTIVLDDGSLAAAQFTPEVLAQLRRFHRFIPAESRHHLELALETDIDGDGHVGPAPGEAPTAEEAGHPTWSHEPAATTGAGGPFVGRRRPGVFASLLLAIALLALGAWLAQRLAWI